MLEIGPVDAPGRAVPGMRVRKSGRTTGLTEGVVADVSADIEVNGYPDRTRSFHNQIIVEGPQVSDRGDSGSVFVGDDNQVVGLLFLRGRMTERLEIASMLSSARGGLESGRPSQTFAGYKLRDSRQGDPVTAMRRQE